MTIDENTIIDEEDEQGNKIRRKITPEEVEKYNARFGFQVDIANQLRGMFQIQNPVFDLLDQLKKQTDYLLKQQSVILANSLNGYFKQTDYLLLDLKSLFQIQFSLKQSYLESIQNIFNLDGYIQQNIRTIAQTLISFKAEILGVKFDFQYEQKTQTETRQFIVEFDSGTEKEDGIVEYTTFERNGVKYKLQAVPENQMIDDSKNAFTGLILDVDDKVLSVLLKMIMPKNQMSMNQKCLK